MFIIIRNSYCGCVPRYGCFATWFLACSLAHPIYYIHVSHDLMDINHFLVCVWALTEFAFNNGLCVSVRARVCMHVDNSRWILRSSWHPVKGLTFAKQTINDCHQLCTNIYFDRYIFFDYNYSQSEFSEINAFFVCMKRPPFLRACSLWYGMASSMIIIQSLKLAPHIINYNLYTPPLPPSSPTTTQTNLPRFLAEWINIGDFLSVLRKA